MNELKNKILNGETIDLVGLIGNEYNVLLRFAEENNTSVSTHYAVDDMLEESGESKIILQQIINPENRNKLTYFYISEEDSEYYNSQIQLSIPNRYTDYSNTIADKILDIIDEDYSDEITFDKMKDEIEEYNKNVNIYNKYLVGLDSLDESMSIDNIENTIIENSNNLQW